MNRKNEKKSLGSSSSKILALLSTNRKAIGGTLVLLAIPALLNNLLTPADVSSQESRKSEKSNSQQLNSSISTDSSIFREKAEKLSNSFRQKGGIFVFLHIPKTGGTAVRSYLMDQILNDTSYLGCWKGQKVNDALISDYCEHAGTPNKTIVVYEAHGGPPCLFYNQLSNTLGKWRELAKKNGVPFFAFTLVREPISWYQSFYNFFITKVGQNVTDAGFFDDPHMKANMQCAELFGIHWRTVPSIHVSYSQCMDALALFKNQMDWVSTTDKLSMELIPLISYLGRFENRNLSVILPHTQQRKKLVLSEFSEKGKEHLRNWTEWDLLLYNDIQGSYDFNNNWKAFLDANGALHPVQYGV